MLLELLMVRAEDSVTPTEAITLVLHPVSKQYVTTKLLKPSEFNSLAIQTLLDCHTAIAQRIPGADNEIISDNQEVQSVQSTVAYKNQVKQGQTLFAAPEEIPSSSEDVEANQTINNSI